SDYQATLTRSYGRDFKRNYSLSINWRKEEYSLSQNANKYRVLVPPDLIETRLNLNMLFGFYYYSTVKYLDNFGNTEDLTLGLWVEFSTGRSFDILDGNILRNYGNATIKTSFRISNNLFVSAEAGISGRYINEDYEHMRYSQRMSLYLKNSHRMISAFRILGRFYDRPDRFTVNYIGGKNGLRGYENFDLAGQNYVIANFEQRYYSPIEILTVAFGTAAFIDAGKTWYEGAGYDSEGWKSNAGIGFRFGLTKSSGFKVVRMDIAKSLTENSYYISFGTEMYFKFAD
ncbi:MAG: hypothetical protein GY855_02535, partial [candidate division Zixibacteria bacterium]|nr:hypothetical protein [candidate division Zixibacteria bacterium]